MLPFAYFLLKVTICSAVLFCYYWFFLRNKIFHAYNRFYMLAIVALSLALPLCRINIFHKAETPKTNVIKMLQVITIGDEYMDDVMITTEKKDLSFADLAPLLYLTVSIVFLIMLCQMLLHIRSLKRQNENRLINDIHFINTDNDKGTPFSFFKYIFWNNDIDLHSPAGNRIFRHELAHIQERHSWDKMFINIVLIVFWCNPIFWLIRKELSMIHEFIADKRAVEDGDTAAFASMILVASYPKHRFSITNNFFYSPIKRRLIMLTKKQNSRINYFSRLAVLPLLVIVFAAFALKTKTTDRYASLLAVSDKQITVIIDAGHGGQDAGARNENGVTEKDMALMLIKKIKELNTNKNINIILTRATDNYSTPQEKAAFAKAQNPDLFISVHLDGSPKPLWNSATGMSIFIANDSIANSESSKSFASAVIGSFKKNYELEVPNSPMQRERVWVLKANSFPSVLIEAGYITNNKDLAYLKSEKGQETFAKNVLNAINDFAGSKNYSAATPKNNYSDTIGYYKGKAVVGVLVRPSTNAATITFADNNREVITIAEANAAHLLPPSPPAPFPPTPSYISDSIRSKKASVKVGLASEEDIKLFKSLGHVFVRSENDGELPYKGPNRLVLRDGVIQPNPIKQKLYKGDIMIILTGKEAVEKYGSKASAGAIEITSKNKYPESLTDKVASQNSQDTNRKVFTKTEIEAEFPGGNTAWAEYIKESFSTSKSIKEGFKPGVYNLILRFIVEQDGTATDVISENYQGTKAAQHYIDIINKGPKWKPAIQNGHIVTAYKRIHVALAIVED